MIERTVNVNENDALEVSDIVIPEAPRSTWQARNTRPLFYKWTRLERFKSWLLRGIARRLHGAAFRLEEWGWPGKRRGPDPLP